mgnify:CR=1 FL=1
MSENTQLMCGIILMTIPTIAYGGSFLLSVLSGKFDKAGFTPFQKDMFRAGHAHAGVLVMLSLIAEILTDYSGYSGGWEWFIRAGFPTAALLIPGGFFAAAGGKALTKPNAFIGLIYLGAILLSLVLISLGVGLIP